MINIKGFRFRPTDEELIEYLQDKTFDRDSLVQQVIAHLQDICQFEPWQLPGRSILQTGDGLWYFMYPPKYKYRNSKRISRTTQEGYWKPTGNARKIIKSDTGEEIGSKKTLVFYKGQCNDKNKNKTCWVMHEYELRATDTVTVSDQKIFNLCKLKKKVDISSIEAGRSSQITLSNLVNHVADNAISEDLLDPNRSSEPEASNDCDSVLIQSGGSVETYAGERSNQHNMINENAIPQDQLHLKEVSTERNGSSDESCNSNLTNDDKMFPIERSNQHNMVDAAEWLKMSSILEYLAHDDNLIPTELLSDYGLSLHELLAAPDATNDSNWIQNQFFTNKEDGEILSSNIANTNEAYLQEGNKQQCLAANNEGSGLPCIGEMESSNSMEKSRKRPRPEYEESNHCTETGEAQPWGKENPLAMPPS